MKRKIIQTMRMLFWIHVNSVQPLKVQCVNRCTCSSAVVEYTWYRAECFFMWQFLSKVSKALEQMTRIYEWLMRHHATPSMNKLNHGGHENCIDSWLAGSRESEAQVKVSGNLIRYLLSIISIGYFVQNRLFTEISYIHPSITRKTMLFDANRLLKRGRSKWYHDKHVTWMHATIELFVKLPFVLSWKPVKSLVQRWNVAAQSWPWMIILLFIRSVWWHMLLVNDTNVLLFYTLSSSTLTMESVSLVDSLMKGQFVRNQRLFTGMHLMAIHSIHWKCNQRGHWNWQSSFRWWWSIFIFTCFLASSQCVMPLEVQEKCIVSTGDKTTASVKVSCINCNWYLLTITQALTGHMLPFDDWSTFNRQPRLHLIKLTNDIIKHTKHLYQVITLTHNDNMNNFSSSNCTGRERNTRLSNEYESSEVEKRSYAQALF